MEFSVAPLNEWIMSLTKKEWIKAIIDHISETYVEMYKEYHPLINKELLTDTAMFKCKIHKIQRQFLFINHHDNKVRVYFMSVQIQTINNQFQKKTNKC